jgi:hypothetical protein
VNLRSRLTAAAGALVIVSLAAGSALASSHREAPLISMDPVADNTDLYAFVSPDAPNTVTIIGNWIPFEEPAGGPNFNTFGDDLLYQFHVDNDGDGLDDVTFSFRFQTKVRNPNTYLYNTGPVTDINSENLNVRQFYWVAVTRDGDTDPNNRDIVKSSIRVAPANVGPRSTPNYGNLAAQAITSVPGGMKVFAGPRDDPFFVDLGSIFDLGGLRPLNSLHILPPAETAAGVDGLKGYNVHSIALQVPITMLTRDGKTHAANEAGSTIGIWTSTSRRSTTVLRSNGTRSSVGNWVQVSRLGNPLINEVVVPVGFKDYWNSQSPRGDSQFVGGALQPELAKLINILYPATTDVDETGRTDLQLVLLQGLPNLNSTGNRIMDMLRLNTGIAPCTADDPTDDTGKCRRLGAFYDDAADLAGYPNGRRLGDDVTDIELRAIGQGYGEQLKTLYGVPNKSPNNGITDGVDRNDATFGNAFPYLATPWQGYQSVPHPGM